MLFQIGCQATRNSPGSPDGQSAPGYDKQKVQFCAIANNNSINISWRAYLTITLHKYSWLFQVKTFNLALHKPKNILNTFL